MDSHRRRHRYVRRRMLCNVGFTTIELVITFALLAILLKLALPAFSSMIANAKVRTTSDLLQNGLRTARAEALKQNRQGVFALTNANPSLSAAAAANGGRWFVFTVAAAGDTTGNTLASVSSLGDDANAVSITGPAALCFNSNGRLIGNSSTGQPGAVCATPAATVAYDIGRASATRALRVTVSLGGQVRMCDPTRSLSAGAQDGC